MNQFIIELIKKVSENLDRKIFINTIFLVGSNYNISNLNDMNDKQSDIDLIVLNDKIDYLIHKEINSIRFDISFINENNIPTILIEAINGSFFYGKFFSSMNKCSIILDNNKTAHIFIKTIQNLYTTLTYSHLPNYQIINNFLHNIKVNLQDVEKENKSHRLFFSIQRLSIHLFDYLTYLVYPFVANGAYRGDVLNKYLYSLTIFLNETHLSREDIKKISQNYCPSFESNYIAIEYDETIESEIYLGNIKKFYFGYFNLFSNQTILFVHKNEKVNLNYKIVELNNIIPFCNSNQLNLWSETLSYISLKYLNTNIKNRIIVLNSIMYFFYKKKYHQTIIESLKSTFIIESTKELYNEKSQIDLIHFHEWLSDIHLELVFDDIYNLENIEQNITFMLKDAIDEELKLKINHIFFGAMKALKIKSFEYINFLNKN